MTRITRLSLFLVFFFTSIASAEDWPQWMGPTRDNVWHEKGIIDNFDKNGPKVLWRTPVGIGYAGPAVANGQLFVMDLLTDQNVKVSNFQRKKYTGTERVLSLNAKTGKLLWKHEYPVTYNISYPSGPRCTPLVQAGKVYTIGAVGHLYCFEAKSGKVLWSKDFVKQYNTTPALWGYASHPFIHNDMLICLVGGKNSHAVAFNKDTGKEIWRTLTSSEQGYSPPKVIQYAGVEQLILLYPDAVTSVNPKTGKPYWSVPYKASNGSIIMTPIHWKDYLYVGGYNNKSMMLKLNKVQPGAKVVWQNKPKTGLSPVNVQPFLGEGGLMYGFSGDGNLYGVNLPDGERIWKTSKPVSERPRGAGSAFIFKQGDRFWLYNENGELIIAKLSAEGYKEIDRTKLLETTNNAFGRDVVWSNPAFANKCIYVRNDKECICVDLSKTE